MQYLSFSELQKNHYPRYINLFSLIFTQYQISRLFIAILPNALPFLTLAIVLSDAANEVIICMPPTYFYTSIISIFSFIYLLFPFTELVFSKHKPNFWPKYSLALELINFLCAREQGLFLFICFLPLWYLQLVWMALINLLMVINKK